MSFLSPTTVCPSKSTAELKAMLLEKTSCGELTNELIKRQKNQAQSLTGLKWAFLHAMCWKSHLAQILFCWETSHSSALLVSPPWDGASETDSFLIWLDEPHLPFLIYTDPSHTSNSINNSSILACDPWKRWNHSVWYINSSHIVFHRGKLQQLQHRLSASPEATPEPGLWQEGARQGAQPPCP